MSLRIIIENADAVMKSTIGKCQHALTGFRPLAPQDGGEVSPPLTRSATKAKPMRLWPIACIMPHATPRDRATRCSAMYQSSCKAGQLHSWCKAGYDANLDEFREMGTHSIRAYGKKKHILYDLKSVLPKDEVDIRL